MKICIKCNLEKELCEFYFRKDNGKYRMDCKNCFNNVNSKRRKENPEIQKEYLKEWRKNNPDYNSNYSKEWRVKNPDAYKNYVKIRSETDMVFKMKLSARKLISSSFRHSSFTKNSKTSIILGCSFEEFKLYIEKQFEPWMNWDNKGLYNGELDYGWDIDHRIPLSSAETEEDIIRLNHYTNLQPLCSKVNRDIKKDNH
jgi:hypothetical protein